MTLSNSIESKQFVATEQQIEALAVAVYEGQQLVGTYLRTLVVAVQAVLGKGRRKIEPRAQVEAVDAIGAKFYGWVRAGLQRAAGGAITDRELTGRAMFARVAASALRKYAAGGGDIRAIDAAEVTRRDLRPEHKEDIPDGTPRAERAGLRAVAALENAVKRMARRDRDEARVFLESALDRLQVALDELEPEGAAPDVTMTMAGARGAAEQRQTRTRVVPMLHRGA